MEQTTTAPRLADLQIDFAATMPDDSMKDRGIRAGDAVYLEACDHVDNGQTAAVRVGNAVLVRVIWQNETQLSLTPANSEYMNIILQGAEMDRAEIIGRVVAYAHVYEKHPGGVKTTPAPNDPREVSE